jgi:hypothetical protein
MADELGDDIDTRIGVDGGAGAVFGGWMNTPACRVFSISPGADRLDHGPRKRERLNFVSRHKYQIEVGEVVENLWFKLHILGNTLHTPRQYSN